MITPEELKVKCEKLFFKVATAHLKGDVLFPLTIPGNKQLSGSNYHALKGDLLPLYQKSKAATSNGYSVEWKLKTIAGSWQNIPVKIFFDSLDDYLSFTEKEQAFNSICQSHAQLTASFPIFNEWAQNNPATLLEYAGTWGDIIKVCRYFVTTPQAGENYIRELPIEVHTKFIEQNASVLRKLLDRLLPPDQIETNETDIALRYRLRKPSPDLQIRVLDENLKTFIGYEACALKIEDAIQLQWKPKRVFIIENDVCFITMPKVVNAVAIFGQGFKSRLTSVLPWLQQTELYCCFDMDASGFEMLNMIRQTYPEAQSFLMDEKTFEVFQRFSVNPPYRQMARRLDRLTEKEQRFYEAIIAGNRRLEQEKISRAYVLQHLNELFSNRQ